MKIGINLLHARPEIGGGWNYIANVVRALALLDSNWRFVAYCSEASAEIVPSDPRFKIRRVGFPTKWQGTRTLFEQSILPVIAYFDKVDCIHWFANNMSILRRTRTVATIHDFKFFENPGEVSRGRGAYLRFISRYACEQADILAPVSETTADKAIRLFGVDRERISVIPNPIDDNFRPAPPDASKEFRVRHHLPPNFWLYVAHFYPHKNHIALLYAYKALLARGECTWPLVLRGDGGEFKKTVEAKATELGLSGAIIWLDRMTTEEMVSLYSSATALIFPSLYEGGGIPVLEAMACGCPIAASDIPTTREFAGDAALTFNPNESREIEVAMQRIANDSALRAAYAKKGLIKAQEYRSGVVAMRLVKAYEAAVSGPSQRREAVAQGGLNLSR